MREPVDEIMQEHEAFWSCIAQRKMEQIYSLGFSYAEVDLPYIRQIVKLLRGGKTVTWNLNSFEDLLDKEGKIWNPVYEKTIRDCGFRGVFGRFS